MRQGRHLTNVPARVSRVEWRMFGSDGMLLDPASGAYLQINEAAVAIWDHIDGVRSIDDIVSVLAGAFEADREAITGDVLDFVERLVEAGMVSIAP